MSAATPTRGHLVGRVIQKDTSAELSGVTVIVQGASSVPEPVTTGAHGKFDIEVETGDWWIVSVLGYKVVAKNKFAVVQQQGQNELVDTPTQVTRQAGGPPSTPPESPRRRVQGAFSGSIQLVLVTQKSDDQKAGPSPEDSQQSCADPAASGPVGGDFRQHQLKVCAVKGARVALYTLPLDSYQKPTLLVTGVPDDSGAVSLDLEALNDASSDYFFLSASKSGYNPAGVTLKRQEIVALLSAQSGVRLDLNKRDGRFEEVRAAVTVDDPAPRGPFLPHIMETLPLPGIRSADSLAFLSPGVFPAAQTSSNAGPGIGPGIGSAGQFSINGSRGRANYFAVDGTDNNDEELGVRRQGFVAPSAQTVESLQEFQTINAIADARFGRNLGAQVSTLARTGGSEFHGAAYGFFTDHRMNARNYFDEGPSALPGTQITLDGQPYAARSPARGATPFTRSQSGLVTSGPLGDQTFFSMALEYDRTRATSQQHYNVPTVVQRGLNGAGASGFSLGGINLTPASLPGNAIFSLFPFPNDPIGPYGANTYTAFAPADQDAAVVSIKIEHIFNTKGVRHFLTLRGNATAENSALPSTGGAIDSTLYPAIDTQNAALFFTSELRPGLSNTFRMGFGRTHASFGRTLAEGQTPSYHFEKDPYLLNAPLLVNMTTPGNAKNGPQYISGTSSDFQAFERRWFPEAKLPNPITGADIISGPVGRVEIAGFSPVGVDPAHFPQVRGDRTFQWNDSVSFIWKRLTLTAGFDVRRVNLDSTVEQNVRPSVFFSGLDQTIAPSSITYIRLPQLVPAVTMAAGAVPSGVFQTLVNTPDYGLRLHRTDADYFVQNQLRLHPKLTLSFGVRIETARLPEDVNSSLLDAFQVAELGQQVSETKRLPECKSNCVKVLNALASQFPADFHTTFRADQTRADLRLGIAWNPVSKLAIRAGGGSYSGPFPAIILSETRSQFPDSLAMNFAGPLAGSAVNLLQNPANPFLLTLLGNLQIVKPGTLNIISPQTVKPGSDPIVNSVELMGLSTSAFSSVFPGLILPQIAAGIQSPKGLNYGITAEYEFASSLVASVGYIGTSGRHLLRVSTPDQGVSRSQFEYQQFSGVDGLTFPNLITVPLSPQTGSLRPVFPISRVVYEGTASSSYHSLQAAVRRRWMSGVQFGGAFTWAHAIDDASDFFDAGGSYALPQDSQHRSERGSSSYDARLRFAAHVAWDICERSRYGGWQLGAIYSAQTGQPYTVNTIYDVNRDGNLTDRLNTDAGLVRNPSADRRVSLSLLPGTDPLSLLAPTGANGAVGRNTFRAPGMNNLDLAFGKRIILASIQKLKRLPETNEAVLRLEMFNALNRTHFGIPVRILESAGFGTSTNTIVPPRTLQIALKLSF